MFEKILHPSDFTETSRIAFAHALKFALAFGAELRLLHVLRRGESCSYSDFPHVREVLEAWGTLPTGSRRRDVPKLGIDVDKLILRGDEPVAAMSAFLEQHPASMIVMATHRRSLGWLAHSRSEDLSRAAHATTLFVPDDAQGIVSPDSGEVQLENILIPIAVEPSASAVLKIINDLVVKLETRTVVHLLHVGTKATLPAVPSESDHVSVRVHLIEGDLVKTIVQTAQEQKVQLVAMATDGHNGFLDALRGSTTEQVLRQLSCPLLAVPPA